MALLWLHYGVIGFIMALFFKVNNNTSLPPLILSFWALVSLLVLFIKPFLIHSVIPILRIRKVALRFWEMPSFSL